MLAKKYRLPIHSFSRQARTIFRSGHLTIKATKNNLPYNRVGVIISRSQERLSTRRNLLRRTVFDFFRQNEIVKKVEERNGRDFLVILNLPKREKIEREELIEELERNGPSF